MIFRNYKGTLLDPEIKYVIPSKKKESRNYFFRIPIKWVGYISMSTFFLLIWFYIILWIFWMNLYQQHFIVTSIITWLNVLLSMFVIFRHPITGKTMIDMIRIIYKYMRKKQIAILKTKKSDLFTKFQVDEFSIKKNQL